MSRSFPTDPWLVDAYRAACTQKGVATDKTRTDGMRSAQTGRLPKRWFEERLLQIPRRLRALSLRLTPRDNDAALSPIEMLAVISILFRRERSPTDRPSEIRNRPTALPLAAAMADKRRHAPFVIPGMQKKAELSCSGQADRPIPMASLEIGGAGVTPSVIDELLFRCMELSQDCILRDLIITSVPEWPPRQDVVSCLSLCGPLRRSLRRLVVVNCPSFRITCAYAWALFFGTTPLEHLTLHNTGLDVHQLATLCEILCDNEIPQDHMRILKLKTAVARSVTDDLADPLLDMEAVHVKRCLSQLRRLECFEMDNICRHQEQELRQEWSALHGTVPSIEIPIFDGTVRLARSNRMVVDMLEKDVDFETLPDLQTMLPAQPQCPVLSSYRTFRVNKMVETTKSSGTSFQIQKPLLGRKLRQRTLLEDPRAANGRRGDAKEALSVAEKLWKRFQPPAQSLRVVSSQDSIPSDAQRLPRKRDRQRDAPFGRMWQRAKPLACYFHSHEGDIEGETDDVQSIRSQEDDTEFRKGPKFKRVYSPNPTQIDPMMATTSQCSPAAHQGRGAKGRFVYEDVSDSDDSFDLANEKLYGPPPGGRTVELQGMDADLMGYFSDGFIRPDDELVYTTSASDDEIEQDLDVLCRRGRRMIALSSSASESSSPSENRVGETSEMHVVEETILVKCDGRTEMKEGDSGERSCRKQISLIALEKELKELEPFYYDRNRQKYKPGQFFELEAPSNNTKGVTLRSGRHVLHSDALSEERPAPTDDHEDEQERSVEKSDHEMPDSQREEPQMVQSSELSAQSVVSNEPQHDREAKKPSPVPAQRCRGSRELQRLQFWSWDQLRHLRCHAFSEEIGVF